ncbi:MAG TPA: SET domain-containing protein-lysine N-methyltransferase [Pyrinomonadaceae bacterium]
MKMTVASEAGHREISNIEIQEKNGHKGVFAKEDMSINAVFKLEGVISDHQSRYSIQLGKDKHLNLPEGVNGKFDNPDFYWAYLNHSCQPNGYIDRADLTFRALRMIKRGEECTFNYLTTEYEMTAPFVCRCGAAKCFGLIQGHRHLSAEQREELAALSATHMASRGR